MLILCGKESEEDNAQKQQHTQVTEKCGSKCWKNPLRFLNECRWGMGVEVKREETVWSGRTI